MTLEHYVELLYSALNRSASYRVQPAVANAWLALVCDAYLVRFQDKYQERAVNGGIVYG